MIGAISVLNTNFGQSRANGAAVTQITPAHILAVTDPARAGYIRQLDALGLINKAMLKKVERAAAQEMERGTASSVDRVVHTLKYPVYTAEARDNGYYYKYENPYNFREKLDAYAQGQKQFVTPVLDGEREYLKALENIAKNGTERDFARLKEFAKQNPKIADLHIASLNMIKNLNHGSLSVCVPQEGTYGVVKEMNGTLVKSFVDQTVLNPFKEMISQLRARLKAGVKSIR